MILNSKIPDGPLEKKWENYKKTAKNLDFMQAAKFRDEIKAIQEKLS